MTGTRYVVSEEPQDDAYWGDMWDVLDTETGEDVGRFGGEDGEIDAQAHADELNRTGGTPCTT